MRIEFVEKENGPQNLLGEAEIHFGPEDGVLSGVKLVGFSLWRSEKGETTVTVPSRSWGGPGERKFFDYVRVGEGGPDSVKRLKASIGEMFQTRDRNAA